MKQFDSKKVAFFLKQVPIWKELSEQTIYTIAHDIAKFREFHEGETICH